MNNVYTPFMQTFEERERARKRAMMIKNLCVIGWVAAGCGWAAAIAATFFAR